VLPTPRSVPANPRRCSLSITFVSFHSRGQTKRIFRYSSRNSSCSPPVCLSVCPSLCVHAFVCILVTIATPCLLDCQTPHFHRCDVLFTLLRGSSTTFDHVTTSRRHLCYYIGCQCDNALLMVVTHSQETCARNLHKFLAQVSCIKFSCKFMHVRLTTHQIKTGVLGRNK